MTETRMPSDVEALHRIVNRCLRPLAPEIAGIGFSGDVAVVVDDLGERGKARARALGWDGKSGVFRLSAEGKRTLAGSTEPSDAGIVTWLGRKFEVANPVARIYVLTGDDSLLVNYSVFGGWAVETSGAPGAKPS